MDAPPRRQAVRHGLAAPDGATGPRAYPAPARVPRTGGRGREIGVGTDGDRRQSPRPRPVLPVIPPNISRPAPPFPESRTAVLQENKQKKRGEQAHKILQPDRQNRRHNADPLPTANLASRSAHGGGHTPFGLRTVTLTARVLRWQGCPAYPRLHTTLSGLSLTAPSRQGAGGRSLVSQARQGYIPRGFCSLGDARCSTRMERRLSGGS